MAEAWHGVLGATAALRVLQLPPKLDARRQASRICCGRQRLWEPVTAVIVGCRGARSGTLSPAQPLDATAGSAGHSSESMLAQAGAGVDVAPASPLGPVRPGIVALWRRPRAPAPPGCACGRPEPRLLSLTARRCDRHGEGDTRHGGRVRGQCRTMTFAAGIVTRRSRRVFPWSGETKRSAPLAVVVKSNGPCRWWSQSSRVRRRGRGTPAAATEAAAAGRAPVPPQAPRPTVTGSADLAISWGTRGRGRSAVPSRMAVVRRTAAPAESVLGRPDRAVPARRSRDVRTLRSWGWPGPLNLNKVRVQRF